MPTYGTVALCYRPFFLCLRTLSGGNMRETPVQIRLSSTPDARWKRVALTLADGSHYSVGAVALILDWDAEDQPYATLSNGVSSARFPLAHASKVEVR